MHAHHRQLAEARRLREADYERRKAALLEKQVHRLSGFQIILIIWITRLGLLCLCYLPVLCNLERHTCWNP